MRVCVCTLKQVRNVGGATLQPLCVSQLLPLLHFWPNMRTIEGDYLHLQLSQMSALHFSASFFSSLSYLLLSALSTTLLYSVPTLIFSPALPHCFPTICPVSVNNSTVAAMDYSTPCRFVCECALCVCVIMYAQCNLWHSLILHSLMQTGKGINMHARDWSDDWFKPVQCMRWINNHA